MSSTSGPTFHHLLEHSFNSGQAVGASSKGLGTKKLSSPDRCNFDQQGGMSLYSMALYDAAGFNFDNSTGNHHFQANHASMGGHTMYPSLPDVAPSSNHQQNHRIHRPTSEQVGQQFRAAFHPVDEYKDLSLPDILDITDDFLLSETPLTELDATPSALLNHLNSSSASSPLPRPSAAVVPSRSSSLSSSSSKNYRHNIADELVVVPPPPSKEDKDSLKKRRRSELGSECSDDDMGDESEFGRRFRPYQAGQWSHKFVELCEYRDLNGHCLVPHTHHENLSLARWVKRQRYQYKLMQEGKPSTMTEERVKALNEIGFVWDSQGQSWMERLAELKDFKSAHGHCNVPSNYSEQPQLATWVKCQRRQMKLHCQGRPSNMTPDRIKQLEDVGFEWSIRTYK